MKLRRMLGSCALLLALSAQGANQQTPQGMTITGDQELPKVLYVTPWRTPDMLELPQPNLENPTRQPLSPCQLGNTLSIAHWPCDAGQNGVTDPDQQR